MSDENFVAFFGGTSSAQKAFITGKQKVGGNIGMASAPRGYIEVDDRPMVFGKRTGY